MNTHDEMTPTPEALEAEQRTRAYSSLAHLELETEQRTFSPKRMFPQLVLGVFFIALLLALTTGALVYKSITDSAAQSSSSRQGAALVCNAVHANDDQGPLQRERVPKVALLLLWKSCNRARSKRASICTRVKFCRSTASLEPRTRPRRHRS